MHLRAFLFPPLSLYISPRNPSVSAPGPLFLAACQSISNVLASYFVPLNHLLSSPPFPSASLAYFSLLALLKSLLVILPPLLPQGCIVITLSEDRSIRERVLYSGDFVRWGGGGEKKISG